MIRLKVCARYEYKHLKFIIYSWDIFNCVFTQVKPVSIKKMYLDKVLQSLDKTFKKLHIIFFTFSFLKRTILTYVKKFLKHCKQTYITFK